MRHPRDDAFAWRRRRTLTLTTIFYSFKIHVKKQIRQTASTASDERNDPRFRCLDTIKANVTTFCYSSHLRRCFILSIAQHDCQWVVSASKNQQVPFSTDECLNAFKWKKMYSFVSRSFTGFLSRFTAVALFRLSIITLNAFQVQAHLRASAARKEISRATKFNQYNIFRWKWFRVRLTIWGFLRGGDALSSRGESAMTHWSDKQRKNRLPVIGNGVRYWLLERSVSDSESIQNRSANPFAIMHNDWLAIFYRMHSAVGIRDFPFVAKMESEIIRASNISVRVVDDFPMGFIGNWNTGASQRLIEWPFDVFSTWPFSENATEIHYAIIWPAAIHRMCVKIILSTS